MPDTTGTPFNLRYPERGDPVQPHLDIENLAEDVHDALETLQAQIPVISGGGFASNVLWAKRDTKQVLTRGVGNTASDPTYYSYLTMTSGSPGTWDSQGIIVDQAGLYLVTGQVSIAKLSSPDNTATRYIAAVQPGFSILDEIFDGHTNGRNIGMRAVYLNAGDRIRLAFRPLTGSGVKLDVSNGLIEAVLLNVAYTQAIPPGDSPDLGS